MDSKDLVVYEAGLDIKFDSEVGDDLLKLDGNKQCDSCERDKKNAIKYCNDCEIHLCQDCSLWHDKFKATKIHKVDTIEAKGYWTCDKHKENAMDKYCVQCEEVCCLKCSEDRHAGHDVETSEAIISNINEFKSYLRYLNKIKLDITENAKNVREQINENTQMLAKKLEEKSLEMIENLETCKNENISEVVEHEKKIKIAINQLLNMRNNFIKMRKKLFENRISEENGSIEKDAKASDINVCCNAQDDSNDDAINESPSDEEEEDYKSIKTRFESVKIEYTLVASLYSMDLDLGLSYNSRLNTKLLRRISVPTCRLMAIDQPSNRLFVISHGVYTFSLEDFQRTLHTNIPLYGDINDCLTFQKCILFSRANENFINVYSLELETDEKLYTKHSVSKMNFISPDKIVCIDGMQSSACIFHIAQQMHKSKTNSFSARPLFCVKSARDRELLLDCVLFDEMKLLGCFYSEVSKSSQLKFIWLQQNGSMVNSDKLYPINDVLLKHDSRNVVMTRDKVNKITIISEGNKLIFYSDDLEFASLQRKFVKVGSINLEEYNIDEPVKIVCHEAKRRLIVMSKTSQDILVFKYEVGCSEYALSDN